jgi:hypothetical protein
VDKPPSLAHPPSLIPLFIGAALPYLAI